MKNKDFIVYSHPVVGDVLFSDVIDTLKYFIKQTKKFETITLDLLEQQNIPKDVLHSLYALTTSSILDYTIEELEEYLNS